MKKILKSWITWVIVAVACFVTAYFINADQPPVEEIAEPIVETVTDEQVATEMEDIVEIDSMIVNEVEITNTVETNE